MEDVWVVIESLKNAATAILGKVALIPSVDALSVFMALQDNASLVLYIAGAPDSDNDEKARAQDDDDACYLHAALAALAVEFGPGANPPALFAAIQASNDGKNLRNVLEFPRNV